jgi:hypothetical protein
MAENKSSFIIYTDWKQDFEFLTDAEAGKLIKHLLQFASDENPTLDNEDRILQYAAQKMKSVMKKDLKKYEQVIEKRSNSGKIGGLSSGESRRSKQKEANEANASIPKQNEGVNVNDNVNEEKEGDFKNFEHTENEKYLIPEMVTIYKKHFPNYPYDKKRDFAPLRVVSEFICQSKGIPYQPNAPNCIAEVSKEWSAVAGFIAADDFFKNYSLSQIERHLQNILQKKNNLKPRIDNTEKRREITEKKARSILDEV